MPAQGGPRRMDMVQGEVGRQRKQRLVLVLIGRNDPDAERVARGVDQQHTLSALDLLAV
jgi:hypothetical protein